MKDEPCKGDVKYVLLYVVGPAAASEPSVRLLRDAGQQA